MRATASVIGKPPAQRLRMPPFRNARHMQQFPATLAGYARLLEWLGRFGTVCLANRAAPGSMAVRARIRRLRRIRVGGILYPVLCFA